MSNIVKTSVVQAALLAGFIVSAPVVAQEAGVSSLEEVMVTAQRRSESLQEVPIAVTALSAEAIEDGDINSLEKLDGQVLGLKVATGTDRTNINIRGIGSTIPNAATEPGVPLNVDGVYMTRTTMAGAVYGDLRQIEVLRGPQGTLYGRNATGGTVNIWTKDPDGETSGELSALVGNGDRIRVRGAVSFPLTETLSGRISASLEEIDGYRNNLTLNEKADFEEHSSIRAAIRWQPSDELDVVFRAMVSSDEVGAPISQFVDLGFLPFTPLVPNSINPAGGQTSVDPKNLRNDRRTVYEYDDEVYSLTANYDMGWGVLKSVTAYQKHDMAGDADLDGSSADHAISTTPESSDAITQEFTLSGGSDRLDWVVGAWYMEDELDAAVYIDLVLPLAFVNPMAPPGAAFRPPLGLEFDQTTESVALFGQATYSVTDRLRATVGVRYSDESKDFIQNIRLFGPPVVDFRKSVSYDDVSPKFGLDYDLTDNMMIYASATKGFKAGGSNVSIAGNTYDPETLWAYEAGMKSDWADGTVRFNLNAYFYEYEGFQSSLIAPGSPSAIITNAADAELQGVETEFAFMPSDGLTFNVNLAYADSEFLDYVSPNQFGPGTIQLAGNQLPLTADLSGNVGVSYEFAYGSSGTMLLSANHSFSSESYFDNYNQTFTQQDSYGRTNARIGYTFDRGSFEGLTLGAYVKNIEDEDVVARADANGLTGGSRLGYMLPRTYGAEMRFSF